MENDPQNPNTINSGQNRTTEEKYFAARPANDTCSVLMQRARSFYQVLHANAYLEKLARMWDSYHGQYYDSLGYGHRISFGGQQGELCQIPVNHFRNLAQHMYTIITSSRPTMDARAVNMDYKSLSQTVVANGILDYYMREKKLEKCLKKAAEMAVVLGSGFIKVEWNATEGEIYDVDEATGKFSYQGDMVFTNLSPFDVVVDGSKEEWDNEWILIRSFGNKYNLMAKYPELASKIDAIPAKSEVSRYRLNMFSNDETDDIPIYEFYHKKTEAMPDGRYLLFVADDIVMMDAKLPYREIPIYRIVPSEIMGTPYGYTPMFDIYPLQEGINSLYSTIMTNQSTFGVQNVYVPRGADITMAALEGGLNVIEANAKPEAINLTETPAEIFKFLEYLIQSAETISGINSVARGNPESSLRSGNALALVQSMAIQFTSGLQQSYVSLIEDVGTSVINILKDFAAAPRVIQIVGKNNKPYLKEFTGEDLNSISRVVVDMGNPLSKTTAGRVQMAEQLLQMKLLTTPEQYFQVIDTGRLDVTYKGEQAELLNIQRENELLLSGQPAVALSLDKHQTHILEHKGVLADPDLRSNAQLVKNVQDHIEEHLNFLRNTDPALLTLIGEHPIPPLQPPMPPGGMAPPPGAPGPGGPQMAPPPQGGPGPMAPKIAPPPQQIAGPLQHGEPISAGPGTVAQKLPNLPKVNASLLPNAALQERIMGNVNTRK